jgi:hypothetical protein
MKTHDTPPPEHDEWTLFLAEAKDGIDRDTTRPAPVPLLRRPAVRLVIPVVAAATLVVGTALVLELASGQNDTAANLPDRTVTSTPSVATSAPGRYTTASQVLTAAAVSSAAQTNGEADAPYWRLVNSDPAADPDETDSGTRIIWKGRTSGSVLFQDGRLSKLPPASFSLQGTSFTWDELDQLTTSPARLAKLLDREASGLRGDPDEYVLKFIGELLSESPASPALRSALWKVAAGLDSATLDGAAQDATGRSGWSVTAGIITYVVEPKTGRILETRQHVGTTSYTSTNVSAGPADRAPKSLEEITPSA